MAIVYGRLYLTREAALRAILHKMEEQPTYRPGGFRGGQEGLSQIREYLYDLRELMADQKTEGDS